MTAKFFITSIVFAQIYQFSLNLNSLQQEFSLTSNYLGTNSVVVKRVDFILFHWIVLCLWSRQSCKLIEKAVEELAEVKTWTCALLGHCYTGDNAATVLSHFCHA